jgi:protein-disulfide isomerase
MKPMYLTLAVAAVLASGACNAENGNSATGNSAAATQAVAPPQGGDWSTVVTQSPEGGFVMGNPNASVKLVEFGSMTCPHCADFDENGVQQLIDRYVKSGRVSYEFRNYVLNSIDLTASLIARCGGTKQFFPLTRQLYGSQREWVGKMQEASPAQQQALAALPPQQQFGEIARLAGLQQWAAQRGVPSAKSSACLADSAEVDRLVQMNSDTTSQYPDFRGTPSFVLNGELLETAGTWQALEPQIQSALGERG